DAFVCTSSGPDPALLPVDVLRQAYKQAVEKLTPVELQYTGPEPHSELVDALLPRLKQYGVTAEPNDLILMSSTRQLLAFSLQIATDVLATRGLMVAVEEPGHHSMLD